MPDIVLVQPPNPILADPTTRWPLGLAYLEAMLMQAGAEVAVVDLRDKDIDLSLIPQAPYVGITATTGEIGFARYIARQVKARDRHTRTVVGGAHATYLPQDCFQDFDIVAVGEWEYAFVKLFKDGHPGGIAYGGPAPDLDDLPFPARHPFSFSHSLFLGAGYGTGPRATSIMTSRGCPMRCSFCQAEPRQVRFRSPEGVVEEIRQLQRDWDCHHFRFEDDNLTLDKSRALALFELMEPLGVKWRGHTRSNLWGDDLAEAARRAGCTNMGFGFEAASDPVLERVRKKETVEQNRQAVRTCKRHGIACRAFWMVGLPGQEWGEINDIKDFMTEERPETYIVSIFSPYPGSHVFAHPEEYGVSFIESDFARYWNFPSWPTLAYEDNPAQEIWQQYLDLKSWLEANFGRG